jgi:uncharacterized protein (DUF362 family)
VKTTYLIDPSLGYPADPPFLPEGDFPEIREHVTRDQGKNRIHGALRIVFHAAGLDAANFGSPSWNPLGVIIAPGQHVVLKPNWVWDFPDGENRDHHLTTHGAFIRAVLDYVVIALAGRGRVSICDGPIQSASFAAILKNHGMAEVMESYGHLPDLRITAVDLRCEEVSSESNKIVARRKVAGDPLGHAEIDLGERSYLEEMSRANPRITYSALGYGEGETNRHHRPGLHRYLVSKVALDADVFVNLPKMKTHKRTGITGALKNLVGINGSKAYLVHSHRDPRTGGDEFARYTRKARLVHLVDFRLKPLIPLPVWSAMWRIWKAYKKHLMRAPGRGGFGDELLSFGGGWHGNRTLWRTIYDLNTILFFGDKNGVMRDEPQRKYLAFVDGIVACEGEGPLRGTARKDGTIIAGDDPVAVDACMAELMGFDGRKIPIVAMADAIDRRRPFSAHRSGADFASAGGPDRLTPFEPPLLWKGHVERA